MNSVLLYLTNFSRRVFNKPFFEITYLSIPQVLQCLSHTPDLSNFSRSSSASTATIDKCSASSTKDQKIWLEFCKLMQQMWQTGAKSVNPSDLKTALSCKYRMYGGSAQQDAQEFLRYLLDALHGALNTGGHKVSLKVNDEMR